MRFMWTPEYMGCAAGGVEATPSTDWIANLCHARLLASERLKKRKTRLQSLPKKLGFQTAKIIDLMLPEPRIRGWQRTGATGRAQLATKIQPAAAVGGWFGRLADLPPPL